MQAAAGVLRAAPDRAEVGQQVDVTLTISPASTEADLLGRTPAEGAAVDVGTARIAPRMRAQLIVPEGATVAVVGSEERAVHDTDDTVWRWSVIPTRTGDLPLRAVLIAPVILDGKETPYDVRTFEARVSVFVTPTTRVRDFVAANWQWLWTALVVPVFLWWRKRRTEPAATVKSADLGARRPFRASVETQRRSLRHRPMRSPPSFRMDPGGAAARLYSLTGFAFREQTQTGIPGCPA